MTPVHVAGRHWLLLTRTVRALRHQRPPLKLVLAQLDELGTRSIWLVTAGMAFFGAVLTTIAWMQARKYIGNVAFAGPAYFQLLVRELGPVVAALLTASRAGAGASAELAAMSVQEQLEALELSAIDPLSELVAPRLIAATLAVPLLCVVGTVAAALAAAGTVFALGGDGSSFIDARYLTGGDLLSALTKSLVCGVAIPLAACGRALDARGGAAAVGEAVTAGVVDACLLVLVLDFLVTLVFLGLGL